MEDNQEVSQTEFLENWQQDPNDVKKAYLQLKELLASNPKIEKDFKARPGVSYSLRGKHVNQSERQLFVMVDVIDDDPNDRWLSVCFYGDMISDPDEKGDLVPEGLMGEDGYCFDLDAWDEKEFNYIATRVKEALQAAEKG